MVYVHANTWPTDKISDVDLEQRTLIGWIRLVTGEWLIIIIIIIRSRRQQRSVASTQSGHDDEPWTIQHECWRVYHCRSAESMNGAGVLAVAANQDQNGSRFLLLRPVIMRGELACGHRVSPHGRTMSFVSRRWHPEHREGWSGRQLLCFWQSHAIPTQTTRQYHFQRPRHSHLNVTFRKRLPMAIDARLLSLCLPCRYDV